MSDSLQCVTVTIPVHSLVGRLEKQIEALRTARKAYRWWQWRKRLMMAGAIAALTLEVRAALELAATAQPVLRDAPKKSRKDDRYKSV